MKSLHCQLTKTKNSSSNTTTSSASFQYFMERPDIFQDIQSFSLEGYTSLQNLTSSSLPLGKTCKKQYLTKCQKYNLEKFNFRLILWFGQVKAFTWPPSKFGDQCPESIRVQNSRIRPCSQPTFPNPKWIPCRAYKFGNSELGFKFLCWTWPHSSDVC